MDHTVSTEEALAELNTLIGEAIVEDDDSRRRALLIMADHWSSVVRGREGQQRFVVRSGAEHSGTAPYS